MTRTFSNILLLSEYLLDISKGLMVVAMATPLFSSLSESIATSQTIFTAFMLLLFSLKLRKDAHDN